MGANSPTLAWLTHSLAFDISFILHILCTVQFYTQVLLSHWRGLDRKGDNRLTSMKISNSPMDFLWIPSFQSLIRCFAWMWISTTASERRKSEAKSSCFYTFCPPLTQSLLNWFMGCNCSTSTCRSVYSMSLGKMGCYYWVSKKSNHVLCTVMLIDEVTQILLLAVNSSSQCDGSELDSLLSTICCRYFRMQNPESRNCFTQNVYNALVVLCYTLQESKLAFRWNI